MKKPSRKMPKMFCSYEGKHHKIILLLDVIFGGGFIWLLTEVPVLIPFLLLIILWGFWRDRHRRTKLNKIAIKRKEDSICTFARSFDYRNVDTWAIRAVYEYIQNYVKDYYNVAAFPLRKQDSLQLLDLSLDIEEDWIVIAKRIGRSTKLDDVEQNPIANELKTVEDLVLFLVHQPKIM